MSYYNTINDANSSFTKKSQVVDNDSSIEWSNN